MPSIRVQVKAAQRYDDIWRDGGSLVAHIKGIPRQGQSNAYLIQYLSQVFGVAPSLITITHGRLSKFKTLRFDVPEDSFRSRVGQLKSFPQSKLF